MNIAFIDIDGTILDYSIGVNQPSENTLKAFKEYKAKGNLLIIATSRSYLPDSMDPSYFDGFIFNNGQYIEFNHEVLLNNTFSTEQIDFLYKLFIQTNAGSSFQGISGRWVPNENKDIALKHMVHYGFDASLFDELVKPFKVEEIEASAITASFLDEKMMKECELSLPNDWEIHAYYDPHDLRIDIHLPGVTKGSSCMKLAEILKIDPLHTYAFGDGVNDIEMLELVGCGIAMGNAPDRVKRIADDVSDSLSHDGLAKAFKKHFNLDLNIE